MGLGVFQCSAQVCLMAPVTVGSDTGWRMFIIGSITIRIPDNVVPSPTLVWLKYRAPAQKGCEITGTAGPSTSY